MEKQILDGLTSLSNEELSEIVTCINMGSLFASVRDQMHSFSAVTHNKVCPSSVQLCTYLACIYDRLSVCAFSSAHIIDEIT